MCSWGLPDPEDGKYVTGLLPKQDLASLLTLLLPLFNKYREGKYQLFTLCLLFLS